MSLLSQRNYLQIATSNIINRHIKSVHDSSTQIINELGTTDIAIGDATAEIMITTLGKIPNEMYYLEDTTIGRKTTYETESHTMILDNATLTSIENVKSGDRSMLLIILFTTLLVILFMCCVTACIIAKSKNRHAFLAKSDVECSPTCRGIHQPLLNRTSDTTRTSSTRD